MINKKCVKKVCIDDFALKRREKYATVMIDIETRKVVDILESRDYENVKAWLQEYPNLEVISRDGSLTYNKAIKDVHSNAIQVSDRFHLLKNLTDYCKEYIKRTVKHRIEIDTPNEKILEIQGIIEIKKKYTYNTKWELILVVRQMRDEGYTINQICQVLGIGNCSVIKYSKIKDCDKEKYNKIILNKLKQANNRKQKEALIQEIKLFKSKGYNNSEISREFNIDRKTVKKYIDCDGTLTHSSLGKTFKSKLDSYKEEIISLLEKRQTSVAIYDRIKACGYNGSASLLRTYISKIKRDTSVIVKSNKEVVERKNIISLLYRDIEKIKSITTEQVEKIFNLYPILPKIYDISKEFKRILLNDDESELEIWINKSKELNIPEINSFIAGVERDIDAIKNAIKYEYSNGLAEGIVNKIKVIKRIMFGRANFELLRRKVLLNNFN